MSPKLVSVIQSTFAWFALALFTVGFIALAADNPLFAIGAFAGSVAAVMLATQ